jgi:carbonic anhydrase/acetyltransferase-like protein (isoleucine patch superfamily)
MATRYYGGNPIILAIGALAIYPFLFILSAGLFCLPFRSGIISGRFPRKSENPVYAKRKLYGACWTCVYYCKPVFFLALHIPLLKRMMFRLFGYKGGMEFTLYPDTWIRDLALLQLGKGAYISNRATLGTNICHIDKTISVGRIEIGENSVVGHMAMIAHGTRIGNDSEVGVGTGIGIRVYIGNHVSIGPMCTINHFARIGNNVRIGTSSYIGSGAVIADNTTIKSGTHIPDRARVDAPVDIWKLHDSFVE